MVLDFPSNPVNGTTYNNYVWDSSVGAWLAQGSTNNVGDQIAGLQAKFPVSVANGGTGATTVAAARDNLGVGLVAIAPPTILLTPPGGSATANSLGEISFTNVTSVSLNNVFSSTYRYYRAVVSLSSGTAGSAYYGIRMRASGSDLATGVYETSTANFSGGTWVASQLTAQTYIRVGITDSQTTLKAFSAFDIANPNVAAHTTVTGTWSAYVGGIATGLLPNTTQYDGMTFFVSTGVSFSGTIQVLGYNS